MFNRDENPSQDNDPMAIEGSDNAVTSSSVNAQSQETQQTSNKKSASLEEEMADNEDEVTPLITKFYYADTKKVSLKDAKIIKLDRYYEYRFLTDGSLALLPLYTSLGTLRTGSQSTRDYIAKLKENNGYIIPASVKDDDAVKDDLYFRDKSKLEPKTEVKLIAMARNFYFIVTEVVPNEKKLERVYTSNSLYHQISITKTASTSQPKTSFYYTNGDAVSADVISYQFGRLTVAMCSDGKVRKIKSQTALKHLKGTMGIDGIDEVALTIDDMLIKADLYNKDGKKLPLDANVVKVEKIYVQIHSDRTLEHVYTSNGYMKKFKINVASITTQNNHDFYYITGAKAPENADIYQIGSTNFQYRHTDGVFILLYALKTLTLKKGIRKNKIETIPLQNIDDKTMSDLFYEDGKKAEYDAKANIKVINYDKKSKCYVEIRNERLIFLHTRANLLRRNKTKKLKITAATENKNIDDSHDAAPASVNTFLTSDTSNQTISSTNTDHMDVTEPAEAMNAKDNDELPLPGSHSSTTPVAPPSSMPMEVDQLYPSFEIDITSAVKKPVAKNRKSDKQNNTQLAKTKYPTSSKRNDEKKQGTVSKKKQAKKLKRPSSPLQHTSVSSDMTEDESTMSIVSLNDSSLAVDGLVAFSASNNIFDLHKTNYKMNTSTIVQDNQDLSVNELENLREPAANQALMDVDQPHQLINQQGCSTPSAVDTASEHTEIHHHDEMEIETVTNDGDIDDAGDTGYEPTANEPTESAVNLNSTEQHKLTEALQFQAQQQPLTATNDATLPANQTETLSFTDNSISSTDNIAVSPIAQEFQESAITAQKSLNDRATGILTSDNSDYPVDTSNKSTSQKTLHLEEPGFSSNHTHHQGQEALEPFDIIIDESQIKDTQAPETSVIEPEKHNSQRVDESAQNNEATIFSNLFCNENFLEDDSSTMSLAPQPLTSTTVDQQSPEELTPEMSLSEAVIDSGFGLEIPAGLPTNQAMTLTHDSSKATENIVSQNLQNHTEPSTDSQEGLMDLNEENTHSDNLDEQADINHGIPLEDIQTFLSEDMADSGFDLEIPAGLPTNPAMTLTHDSIEERKNIVSQNLQNLTEPSTDTQEGLIDLNEENTHSDNLDEQADINHGISLGMQDILGLQGFGSPLKNIQTQEAPELFSASRSDDVEKQFEQDLLLEPSTQHSPTTMSVDQLHRLIEPQIGPASSTAKPIAEHEERPLTSKRKHLGSNHIENPSHTQQATMISRSSSRRQMAVAATSRTNRQIAEQYERPLTSPFTRSMTLRSKKRKRPNSNHIEDPSHTQQATTSQRLTAIDEIARIDRLIAEQHERLSTSQFIRPNILRSNQQRRPRSNSMQAYSQKDTTIRANPFESKFIDDEIVANLVSFHRPIDYASRLFLDDTEFELTTNLYNMRRTVSPFAPNAQEELPTNSIELIEEKQSQQQPLPSNQYLTHARYFKAKKKTQAQQTVSTQATNAASNTTINPTNMAIGIQDPKTHPSTAINLFWDEELFDTASIDSAATVATETQTSEPNSDDCMEVENPQTVTTMPSHTDAFYHQNFFAADDDEDYENRIPEALADANLLDKLDSEKSSRLPETTTLSYRHESISTNGKISSSPYDEREFPIAETESLLDFNAAAISDDDSNDQVNMTSDVTLNIPHLSYIEGLDSSARNIEILPPKFNSIASSLYGNTTSIIVENLSLPANSPAVSSSNTTESDSFDVEALYDADAAPTPEKGKSSPDSISSEKMALDVGTIEAAKKINSAESTTISLPFIRTTRSTQQFFTKNNNHSIVLLDKTKNDDDENVDIMNNDEEYVDIINVDDEMEPPQPKKRKV